MIIEKEAMNMKKMLMIFMVTAFSSSLCFAVQQPAAPKAGTSAKAASLTNSVSKPITGVSQVAPKPAAPANPIPQQPAALVSQATQQPATPVSQTVQQPVEPVSPLPHKLEVSPSQMTPKPVAPVTKTAGASAGTKIFTGNALQKHGKKNGSTR